MICVSGACGQCPAFAGSPRFVDNGNGTITDRQTCLVWEKKDDAGGIHDKDNYYQWSSTGTNPDGGAFTVFLAGLNSAGFAGHHDWRLPTSAGCCGYPTGQAAELESIVDSGVSGCGSGSPCVDPPLNTNCGTNSSGNAGCTVDGAGSTQECSCTVPSSDWSGSTVSASPGYAWGVYFYGGYVGYGSKAGGNYARGVRGGL